MIYQEGITNKMVGVVGRRCFGLTIYRSTIRMWLCSATFVNSSHIPKFKLILLIFLRQLQLESIKLCNKWQGVLFRLFKIILLIIFNIKVLVDSVCG